MKRILPIVALLAASLAGPGVTVAQQPKPNIVLVLMDNLGWGELGVYGGGILRGAPTPRIDKLASEGMRLLNFNVEAQCTPSRAALMTGRYAIRTGNGSVPIDTPRYGLTQWEVTMAEMLSDEEHARRMEALPGWFKPLVAVAMLTGMRRSELLRLRWSDVDVETGSVCVRPDKAGDGRWVVLNAEALETLRSIRRKRVLSSLVFTTPEGQSLHNNFKRYWNQARSRAKLEDFRFHDLRHTFASRLVRLGVSSYVVQHAGGWRTASMMARYAHLDPTTIRAAVELLTARPTPSAGANGHQNGHHRPNTSVTREPRTEASA